MTEVRGGCGNVGRVVWWNRGGDGHWATKTGIFEEAEGGRHELGSLREAYGILSSVGDVQAFSKVIQRHATYLCKYCWRAELEITSPFATLEVIGHCP